LIKYCTSAVPQNITFFVEFDIVIVPESIVSENKGEGNGDACCFWIGSYSHS
jgi:hypothetical protein